MNTTYVCVKVTALKRWQGWLGEEMRFAKLNVVSSKLFLLNLDALNIITDQLNLSPKCPKATYFKLERYRINLQSPNFIKSLWLDKALALSELLTNRSSPRHAIFICTDWKIIDSWKNNMVDPTVSLSPGQFSQVSAMKDRGRRRERTDILVNWERVYGRVQDHQFHDALWVNDNWLTWLIYK
jgi:hypothetical protein